jgi:MYXO-CTERM domain-containing protein
MNGFAKIIGWSLLAGVACLFTAGGARAATNPPSCANDIDCVATPQCGGDVCPYDGPHPLTCQPAGSGATGMDGWCTVDTDCKCYAQGARCNGAYCSFTKPSGGGGSTGGAGTTGTGGGTGTAGSTGSAGSGSNDSGGGCRVANSPAGGGSLAAAALGLGLVVARRRRRG